MKKLPEHELVITALYYAILDRKKALENWKPPHYNHEMEDLIVQMQDYLDYLKGPNLYEIKIYKDGERHRLSLSIDHQSFWIGEWLEDDEFEDGGVFTGKDRAKWMENQLRKAIDRLIKKAREMK